MAADIAGDLTGVSLCLMQLFPPPLQREDVGSEINLSGTNREKLDQRPRERCRGMAGIGDPRGIPLRANADNVTDSANGEEWVCLPRLANSFVHACRLRIQSIHS